MLPSPLVPYLRSGAPPQGLDKVHLPLAMAKWALNHRVFFRGRPKDRENTHSAEPEEGWFAPQCFRG
jgi:hypothetical protein